MFADAVKFAFEVRLLDEFRTGHEDLHREGFALCRLLAEAGGVHRHLADVAEHAALVFDFVPDAVQDALPLGRFLGQEHQAGAVASFFRDGDALQEYEFVRDLQHDSGAVARLAVCALGAAVAHVLEHGQSVVHQLVGLVAADVYDHTDPAGIVFRCRII